MSEAVVIGENKVAPGERATFDLPIVNLSTHTSMTLPVMVINGRKPGPRLFVSAAIHGDEINGVEIVGRLLADPRLDNLRGALIAVPIVNVFGFINQSRYLPDRRDLNRSFPGSAKGSLAGRLANLFLERVVSGATHGVDLHTGAIHRTNLPQIRANLSDPDTARLASAFGAPVIINSGFRAGSLREAAARRSVPVLVYEAGEALRFEEDCIAIGLRGVFRVLEALAMLPAAGGDAVPAPVIAGASAWTRAPVSGVLRDPAPMGRTVAKGEILGTIVDPFGHELSGIEAKSGGIIIGRSNLPVVYEGDALFHIVSEAEGQVDAETLDVPSLGEEEFQAAEAELLDQDAALTYG